MCLAIVSYYLRSAIQFGFGYYRDIVPNMFVRQCLFLTLNPILDLFNIAAIYILHSMEIRRRGSD